MATKKIIKKSPKAKAGKVGKSSAVKSSSTKVQKKTSAASAKKSAAKSITKPASKNSVKSLAKKTVKVSQKTSKPLAKSPVKKAVKNIPAKSPLKNQAKNNGVNSVSSKSKVTAKAAQVSPAKKSNKNEVKNVMPVKKATTAKKSPEVKTKSVVAKAGLKKVAPKASAPVAQPLPSVKNTAAQVSIVKHAPATQTPKTPVKTKMSNVQNTPERSRYSDVELNEFKDLIIKKLDDARTELVNLQAQIINANENGTDDTGATFKMLEDGSDTLAKEEAAQLAARQKKFIEQLEAALVRIENKTYGICRVTGKLIPKERLRAVPHTTQSMEAKLKQYRD